MDGQGQAEHYTDALELAFDSVKGYEALGMLDDQDKRQHAATMAQLWCLIAIATEVRNLRQELLAGLDAAAPGLEQG